MRFDSIEISGKKFSFPTMSTSQRDLLNFTSSDESAVIYNTTSDELQVWNGSSWKSIDSRVTWILSTDNYSTLSFTYPSSSVDINSSGTISPSITSGTQPAVSWDISSGSLPSEFSFNTSTGVITYSTGATTGSGSFGVTATTPVGTSNEVTVNWDIGSPNGITTYTNSESLYPSLRISTSNSTDTQILNKLSFYGTTSGMSDGTIIENSQYPIYAADNGNSTWNYLILPDGASYWIFYANSTTDPSNLANNYSSDLSSSSLSYDLVSLVDNDVNIGGTTNYSSATVSGVSSTFNGTYTRQSSEFSLDGASTSSGSALWNENGGYYYFVKSDDNSKIIVYNEVDSQWQLVMQTGTDFTTSPSNNGSFGSLSSISSSSNTSTQYENSVNQPTQSSTYGYTSGGVNYPSDRGDIHYRTELNYIDFGNDTSIDDFMTSSDSWSYGFKLVDKIPLDALGRVMFSRSGRSWFALAIGQSASDSEVIYGNGSTTTYDFTEDSSIPATGFAAGSYVRITYDTTTVNLYVDGTKYYSFNPSTSYLDVGSAANTLDLHFGYGIDSNAYQSSTQFYHGHWQGKIERLWIANGTEVTTDDDGSTFPTGTTHSWLLDETSGSTFSANTGGLNGTGATVS